ncbi:MAG: hypothetical protein NC123_12355 [Butyrivibrio sp.]|nr:hypothetical protein [Acetatifactor muris]MCM1560314.1 hypothetical protein [Butyrivibrio sp.]
MSLSIGAFNNTLYTNQADRMPVSAPDEEQRRVLTPAEELKKEEKEQKQKELMGIEDPLKPENPAEPKKPGEKKKPGEECQTCKERKYQDGSDEMVSFKSAAHISPESAAARVRAHEQEHVSNAYAKAAKAGGKVISASVSIHTAICPECGRTYVSGGTTQTQIKYYNEENPYQRGLKTADQAKYSGMNADYAV